MISFKRGLFSRVSLVIWVMVLFCASTMFARAQCTGNNVADDEKYRVRNVTVNALFGSVPEKLKTILAKHKNELFQTAGESFVIGAPGAASESSLDRYRQEVFTFFEEDNTFKKDSSFGVNQQDGLYIRATFSSTCVKLVPAVECEKTVTDDSGLPATRCVDVEVKIRVIPINTANPSSNLLDLARSNQVRFYRELPSPLLALNPGFGIEHDNSYGSSVVGSISSDLLSLPSILKNSPTTVQKTQLRLALDVRKSLKLSLYDINSTLTLSHSRPLKFFEKFSGSGSFTASREIKGDGVHTKNAVSIGFGTLVKVNKGPVDQVRVAADYRRTVNRFSDPTGVVQRATERSLAASIATDGRVAGGFTRAGAWFDYSSPESMSRSYGRAVAVIGYSKNFVLPQEKCIVREGTTEVCVFPKNNPPVIGFEALAGVGKSWGDVPDYARFFGGNTGGNFLYDAIDGISLTRFPDGPLIRSFGRNKAGSNASQAIGVRGGTSFSHMNLTVSLPVKSWSRPLIPAVAITNRGDDSAPLTCAQCTSLKTVLKNQVDKGKNIYMDAIASRSLTPEQRDDLALEPDDGLTPEEAARLARAEEAFAEARLKVTPEADEVWRMLTPTVAYIADNANLFSVKPLVMFDVARISDGAPGSRSRVGLGGGLQFNVVVAKFELGYVRTVRGLAGDGKGNFVARMVFEKLF